MLKSQTAKGRCICLMTNLADICRECELASRNRELEAENISLRQAGHRLAMLICDIVLDKKIDEEAMRYAIAKWSKARDKEEEKQ